MDLTSFRVNISDTELADLRRRLDHIRWPQEIPGTGWSRGVPLSYLMRLVDVWRTTYDWRKQEALLNRYPQFVASIDGQNIHFIHARSPEPDALPLVITHGYPSSTVEFTYLIEKLTDPRAHGGDPGDAFHVVIPSLPGFGFSGPVREQGWALGRTARAWAELMKGLGYDRYGAHGGDIGGGVSGLLANIDGIHLIGTHILSDPSAAALIGMPLNLPADQLTEAEKKQLQHLTNYQNDGRGYLQLQSTRPQTLAFGLNDSPVAQLAWIIEKFKEWVHPSKALPEDAINVELLLTNASIYWFTGTGASAAQFIYEAFHSHDWPIPSPIPQGWAVFGTDNTIMKRLLNPGNQIEHWSEFSAGGHFPALEESDLLAEDLRKFFRKLRKPLNKNFHIQQSTNMSPFGSSID
jgi:epoxide hydrolase